MSGGWKLDFNLLKGEKLGSGEEEETFRSSCMFAHRFEHYPVSGILAFMSEIIGHFLIFQSFFCTSLHVCRVFQSFSIISENNLVEAFRHMHLLMLSASIIIPELTIIKGISGEMEMI